MAPRVTFASLTDGLQPFSLWDQMYADTGLLGTIPCTTSGTNAITLTSIPSAFAPNVTAYTNYLRFSFVAGATSTGAVTIQVGSLAFENAYSGALQVGSGGIVAGHLYSAVYVSTLNSGAGGFQISDVTAGSSGASATPIDIFLVVGDSNAVGQGTTGPTVPTGMVLQYAADGSISDANDPTRSAVNAAQNAATGSMWPALGIAYGRQIGFVLTGKSGSTQASAADFHVGNGNWQDTSAGSNYANSLTAINAALPAFTTAGYSPTFRGVIYVLGSNDAAQIDSSVITVGQYTSALTAMVGNYRGATIGGKTYPEMQIYMPIIGTTTVTISDAGYSQVRAAQLAWVASDKNTQVPFTGMYSFNSRGMMQAASAHPTQAGYNIMGTAIGGALVPAIQAPIPYQLFSANAGIGGAFSATNSTVLQVIGADGVANDSLFDAYAAIPEILLRRADTTLQAPSAVQSGEIIGIYAAQSYGATTFGSTNQGAVLFSATQNHTDTSKGTRAAVYTTANGSATPAANLTVDQNGFVGIGSNLTPDSPLTVNANTGAVSLAPPTGTIIHVIGADGVNSDFIFDNFANSAGTSSLFFARAAGGTRASPVALPAASVPFAIFAQGYDGVSANRNLASIDLLNINQTSPTDAGGQVRIRTTATGTTTFAQRVLILQGVIIGSTTTDPGAGALLATDLYSNDATFLIRTKTTLTNNAAANTGTITNAPSVGNPTKWIGVDDNGTTRFVPAW